MIVRCWRRFVLWVYSAVSGGFLGKLFSCYTKENDAFKRSMTASFFKSGSILGELVRKLRYLIAEQFETSRIVNLWRKAMQFLIGARMRLFGSFMIMFGIYVGLVYFFKKFIILLPEAADPVYLVWSAVFTIGSFPLLLSNSTLVEALSSSRVGHFVVCDVLGVPDEKLRAKPTGLGEGYNVSIFIGVVAGTLSYFIDPSYIILAIFIFIAISLVVTHPEIGVISALVLLPTLSIGGTETLKLIVFAYSFSYLIKLLRGKRTVSFEIIDLMLLFFAIIVAFGGIVTLGGEAAIEQSNILIFMIVGGFVAGNLMKTAKWLKRCICATVFSGSLASFAIIWQYAAKGFEDSVGISLRLFEGEKAPFFSGNDELLGIYLIVPLVLAVAASCTASGLKTRIVSGIAAVSILAAFSLTGSALEFTAVLVAIVALFLILTPKTVTVMTIATVGVGVMDIALSGFVRPGVLAGMNTWTGGISHVMNVWHGTFQMIAASLFGGVGIGGFSRFYSAYAAVGFETADNSNSLWLGLLCDLGLVGLLVFCAVIFLCFQNCFEYLKRPLCKSSKAFVAASIASLLGILTMAIFCDFRTNAILMYEFWLVICIACAGIRCDKKEIAKNETELMNNAYSASVTL